MWRWCDMIILSKFQKLMQKYHMKCYNNFFNNEATKIPNSPWSLHQQIPLDVLHSWPQDVRHCANLHLWGECLHPAEWESAQCANQHEKTPTEEVSASPYPEGWYLHPIYNNKMTGTYICIMYVLQTISFSLISRMKRHIQLKHQTTVTRCFAIL